MKKYIFAQSKYFILNLLGNIFIALLFVYITDLNKVIEECEINKVLGKNDLNLNSKILENGKNLSGGQKQIIAVARTLLKDASIYIFDEPTSSIDNKTSIIIHEALKRIDGILIEVTHDKSKEITTGFDEIIEVN